MKKTAGTRENMSSKTVPSVRMDGRFDNSNRTYSWSHRAHSYSPREVKASVAGYGAASKQQMQQMVTSSLGLTEVPEPADASDALAVALCHAHLSRARDRMAAATAKKPDRIAVRLLTKISPSETSGAGNGPSSRNPAPRIQYPR